MKKIIAIFSVMLTFGVMLPHGGFGAENCFPHQCPSSINGTDRIAVDAFGGSDKGCWYCEDGEADDDSCDGNENNAAIVATVDFSTGAVWRVYKCSDGFLDNDRWDVVPITRSCQDSQLSFLEEKHETNYDCWISLDNGTSVDYRRVTPKASSVGNVCVICSCKPGKIPNSAGTDCEADPNMQQTCENAPSHGYWDSTNSKCLCGAADRAGKDNKGYGQTYDVQDQKCKCSDSSHIWSGAEGKCVDPNAAYIEECENSGGQWNGTECTNCDSGRGLEPAPGNKTCKCSNNDEEYSPGANRCVSTEQANCEKSGGTWDGTGKCACDSNKNIVPNDNDTPKFCLCKNEDYDWKSDSDKTQGCDLKPEARSRKDNFEKSKEACEDWGGTWSPVTWEAPQGVDVTKWKCECPNSAGVVQATAVSCKCDIINGYQETAPNTCTQTTCADLQTKCNAVSDASYKTLTAHGGQEYCECVCNDRNKAYNYSTNECEAITNICGFINDAVLDRYGNCVCKSNLLPPVRGKCPSGTSSGSASGGGASPGVTVSPQQIAQVKQNVSDVYDDLKSISDGFGRSHWKTASGNFNGARLASDSIAGVVLGTVGGVVTSNVIKKNQVKGGFESLQCTVGGQLVADFADQFQVGIR